MQQRSQDQPPPVLLNGQWQRTEAASVLALVSELGYDPSVPGIAVAVNDAVVPRSQWHEHPVCPGDRVEVVGAVQGG